MAWIVTEYDGYTVAAPLEEWHLHDRLIWERGGEYRSTCECNPRIILDYDKLTIIHNSFDGTHALEEANEILNKK